MNTDTRISRLHWCAVFCVLFLLPTFLMAIITKKIIGSVSGRTGEVVSQKWKNKQVARSIPAFYQDANSPLQQPQRENVRILDSFIKALNQPFKKAYKPTARKNLWQNLFISSNSFIYNPLNLNTIRTSVEDLKFSPYRKAGFWPILAQNVGNQIEWTTNPNDDFWPDFENWKIDIFTFTVTNNQVNLVNYFPEVERMGIAFGFLPLNTNSFISVIAYPPPGEKSTPTESVTFGFVVQP